MYVETLVILVLLSTTYSTKLPLEVFQHSTKHHYYHYKINNQNSHKRKTTEPSNVRILYQLGNSESQLPVCSTWAVCNKIDLYDTPWLERKCRCPGEQVCPSTTASGDGHTISDRHRQYKLCEPIKKLPKCRYFRDVTWTIVPSPDNFTEQIVHCYCPKNSVTYLIKRQSSQLSNGRYEFRYSFACSPQTRFRCQRKEPCRLFAVHKLQELFEAANTYTLCQCPHAHRCPHHHRDYGVIPDATYTHEPVRTYSGFCLSS